MDAPSNILIFKICSSKKLRMALQSLRILATAARVSRARFPPLFIADLSLIMTTMALAPPELEYFPAKRRRLSILVQPDPPFQGRSLAEVPPWAVFIILEQF